MTLPEFCELVEWMRAGVLETRDDGQENWHLFDYAKEYISSTHMRSFYRRKPEKKWRAWKNASEVPVGALIKRKKQSPLRAPAVILGVDVSFSIIGPVAIISQPMLDGVHYHYFLEDLASYHGDGDDQNIHSTDHGKTWHPCGVEESA